MHIYFANMWSQQSCSHKNRWCHSRYGYQVQMRLAVFLLMCIQAVQSSWGGSDEETDTTIFGNSLARDWMSESTAVSIQLDGCAWGYVADNEEAGCMENGSQDGTTYWYQMANCRRAQAVFSVYGTTSSSASCNRNNFKESFVTKYGLSEFLDLLAQYDANSPFGDNYNGGNDDQYDDDGGNDGNNGFDDLPLCENGIGLGCADDGTFALQYFSDSYCLKPTGKTYDRLKSLNRALRTYRNCASIYTSGNDNTLLSYLVSTSESCSSLDNGLCSDNSAMKDRRSHAVSHSVIGRSFVSRTWVTKLKYATGGLLLLASFVMFTGILFTNRRRRRALLQRKYRQSRGDRSRKSSSRSKSKSRGDGSRKPSRSRSKAKVPGSDSEGVFA